VKQQVCYWGSLNHADDGLFYGDFTRDHVIIFLLPRGHIVPVTEMAEKRGLTLPECEHSIVSCGSEQSCFNTDFSFLISGCGRLLRKLSKDSLYSFSRIAWFLSKSTLMLQVLHQIVAIGLLVNVQNCLVIHMVNIIVDFLHYVLGPCVILDRYSGHMLRGGSGHTAAWTLIPAVSFFRDS
jgi:hypothetical protein